MTPTIVPKAKKTSEIVLRIMSKKVLILGMRRSGTSLTAKVLLSLGFYFENDSRPPDKNNPEGYWESKRIHDFNAGLLTELGGTREFPPRMRTGWERSSTFDGKRLIAASILKEYDQHQKWGIKDTTFSLTLPIWKQLLSGDTSFIICVRNPLAVVMSSAKMRRRPIVPVDVYRMWYTYVAQALKNTQDVRRLVLHYEDFQIDSEGQVKLLCSFLGLEFRSNLAGVFSPGLIHHRPGLNDLLESPSAPLGTKKLYSNLLSSRKDPALLTKLTESLSDFEGHTPPLTVRLRSRIQLLKKKLKQLLAKGQHLAIDLEP